MKFQPGQSGNPAGRPAGSANKITNLLREKIALFLDENWEKIKIDLMALKPAERVRFYVDLLQFGLPKLQAVQLETDFEQLTDEQINTIIEGLRNPHPLIKKQSDQDEKSIEAGEN